MLWDMQVNISNYNLPITKDVMDKVIELRNRGVIIKDIVSAVGISVWSVSRILRVKNMTKNRSDPEPEPKLIDRVVKLKKQGMNHTLISKELGISIPFVSKICKMRGITRAR